MTRPDDSEPDAGREPRRADRREHATGAGLGIPTHGLRESDLHERFVKGAGPGGQKINKTASCVYLKHVPTGIEVKCQASRSLAKNRTEARRLLAAALAERARQKRLAKQRAAARARAKKRRPSARQRAINVEGKRRHGEKKRLRRRPRGDE